VHADMLVACLDVMTNPLLTCLQSWRHRTQSKGTYSVCTGEPAVQQRLRWLRRDRPCLATQGADTGGRSRGGAGQRAGYALSVRWGSALGPQWHPRDQPAGPPALPAALRLLRHLHAIPHAPSICSSAPLGRPLAAQTGRPQQTRGVVSAVHASPVGKRADFLLPGV